MAGAIRIDIIDGHIGTVKGGDQWEFDRIAIVKGVTGEEDYLDSSDIGSRLKAAIYHPEIPQIGDSYPYESSAILYQIDCIALDADIVKLRLKYRTGHWKWIWPKETSIESSGSLIQRETNKDYNNDLVTLSYTYPNGETVEISPLMPISMPQETLTFRRDESSAPYSYNNYIGKVNDGTWQGGVAYSWLCTGITGRKTSRSFYWSNVFTFQYDPITLWRAHAIFIDPNTGQPPPDLTADGDKLVHIYEAIDFDGLGL